MPTATATRKQTAVETNEEPEVVVDPRLNKLVDEWGKTKDKTDRFWMQIAAYVRDKEITAKQLLKALIEVRGLKETSARVEVSRFMRFTKSQEASDMLDEALEGDSDITVADLRSAKVLQGEKGDKDPGEVLDKKLVSVCRYAIREADITDIIEFVGQAKRAFKTAYNKEVAAQTAGNGEEETEEEE